MNGKRVVIIWGMKILFIMILFLLGGCSIVKKTAPLNVVKQEPKKRIMDDILAFRDLQQIDLDKDGEKEIIAIYTTRANSSGVKVIKFSKDKGNIVFERIFNTPNTKFEMKKGIPTIVVEEIGTITGRRFKGIYRWDGKAFVLEQK